MPKAKHIPPVSFSDHDGFKLDELLHEFKQAHPEVFDSAPTGLGSKKISPDLDGWQLATRPEVWQWFLGRLGVQATAMAVAHWLIGKRDHAGVTDFRGWLITHHHADKPFAVDQMTRWLKGEQRISANRSGGGGYEGKDASQAWWLRVTREHPGWASGKVNNLPYGFAKELAAECYGSSADYPESENGLEKLEDRIVKALRRARNRHLKD